MAGKDNAYTVLKLRLSPTQAQAALMEKTFGCCRYLWNQMLADTQEFYAATDQHFIPTPAKYKKGSPFLAEVDSQALCAVHQNLRKAYLDFFRAPATFGPPQFKTKKSKKDSFTVYCRPYRTGPSIRMTEYGLQMPKLGFVRAKVHRKPLHWWTLRFVTISKTKSGKYFAAITFGYTAKLPQKVVPTASKTLGLNHSLTRFYVDSNGNCPTALPGPQQEKLAKLQRKLSRMQPGSKNYQEQLQKIRLFQEHIANQRKDFIHKESRRIANAWDAVCVRDADLVAMAQTLQQAGGAFPGFGMFRACLSYKLARQGKAYITVDRYAPVAKTCHACGQVNEQLNPRHRRWICPACGTSLSREINTAQNIQAFGLVEYFKQNAETSAA